jgi:membrane protein YqaA with SNARE-associated domain
MSSPDPEVALDHGQARLAARVHWLRVLALAVLVVLIAAALFFFVSGTDLCSLAAVGLPGLTVIMFLSSATVLLPAPGIAAVGLAGTAWNPLLVASFAAFGSSLGELTGYLLGYGGRKALGIPRTRWWDLAERAMRRWGFMTLLVLAAIPNPAFDVVGILAGSLGFSPKKLVIAIFIGNFAKYVAAAMLGDAAIGDRSC